MEKTHYPGKLENTTMDGVATSKLFSNEERQM